MKRIISGILIAAVSLAGCATAKARPLTSTDIMLQQVSDGLAAVIMIAPWLPVALPIALFEELEKNAWKTKYAKVSSGMSKEEIGEILGRPRKCTPEENSPNSELCGYGKQQMVAPNEEKYWVEVTFVQGRSIASACSS